MWRMNLAAETPDLLKRNRFCGLPKGISSEPLMAAIFSMEMMGRMHSSRFTLLKSSMVRGTNIISDTSLVTNIDVKKTPKTRKRERVTMVVSPEPSLRSGLNRFSCLKPSSTVSIMKSIPRVCQSIAVSSSFVGGVMSSDISAASSDTGSIGSFFMSCNNFFIGTILRAFLFSSGL